MRRRRHKLESDGLGWVHWGTPEGAIPRDWYQSALACLSARPCMYCGCRPDWGAVVHLQRWRCTSCRNRVVLQR